MWYHRSKGWTAAEVGATMEVGVKTVLCTGAATGALTVVMPLLTTVEVMSCAVIGVVATSVDDIVQSSALSPSHIVHVVVTVAMLLPL
jgi:hypothetical protein